MVYNGKTEAIPFANGGKWMFYNKQMLADAGYEEPPKTWDELKEMSQDMIDKGICKYGIAWGASQAEGLICDLTTMIYSFGGTWQKEDASFDINSESANDAVQFMYDSMQEGWADPASITYTDRDCLRSVHGWRYRICYELGLCVWIYDNQKIQQLQEM